MTYVQHEPFALVKAKNPVNVRAYGGRCGRSKPPSVNDWRDYYPRSRGELMEAGQPSRREQGRVCPEPSRVEPGTRVGLEYRYRSDRARRRSREDSEPNERGPSKSRVRHVLDYGRIDPTDRGERPR